MQPEVDIVGLHLQTFGMAFGLAFVAAGALIARRLHEIGRPREWAWELIFVALIGGLAGSRAYYLIQNYDRLGDDLLGALFSGSGLIWYGGLVGGAAAVAIWGWRRKFRAVDLLDLCA